MNKYIKIARMGNLSVDEQAAKSGKSVYHWRQIRSALIHCGIVQPKVEGTAKRKPRARKPTKRAKAAKATKKAAKRVAKK